MKIRSRSWTLSTLIMLTCCLTLAASRDAMAESEEDKWEFISPFYVWVAGVDGDATIKGKSSDVDLSINDVLEHTDIALQGYFELRKRKFGFYINPTYMDLSFQNKNPNNKFTLDVEMAVVDFGAFYNVGEWFEEHPLTVDVYGGGRYWNVALDAKLNDFVVPFVIKKSGSEELIDPIIGARLKFRPIKKLFLVARGDIGGFNISEGTTTKFTWQAAPLAGYDFNKYFTVFAGYRWLGIDTDEGSGAHENGIDLVMSGPQFGFNFDIFTWWQDRKK